MQPTARLVALLSLALLAPAVLAQSGGLDRVLSCQEAPALAGDPAALQALAVDAGFECREHPGVRHHILACSGGRARGLGVPVLEFELAGHADGSRVLAVTLRSTPEHVRARLPADTSDAGLVVELDAREDGRAELRCHLPGDRPAHGSIAGTLDFRGLHPVPAMRVCATAVSRRGAPHCVQTTTGQTSYRIDGLPPGEYYVTAFATEDNPNRLHGAYTQPLRDCTGSDCMQRLQRVPVLPGEVSTGIDPITLMQELPSFLRRR